MCRPKNFPATKASGSYARSVGKALTSNARSGKTTKFSVSHARAANTTPCCRTCPAHALKRFSKLDDGLDVGVIGNVARQCPGVLHENGEKLLHRPNLHPRGTHKRWLAALSRRNPLRDFELVPQQSIRHRDVFLHVVLKVELRAFMVWVQNGQAVHEWSFPFQANV